MLRPKTRWGLPLFLLAPVLAGLAFVVVERYRPDGEPVLYDSVLPALGIAFSLIAFLVGHFSYPRVHNLKVYSAGYLIGLTQSAYFLFFKRSQLRPEAITALFVLALANLIFCSALPSHAKYRTARRITWSAALLEIAFLAALHFHPAAAAWTATLSRAILASSAGVLALLALGTTIGLSIWKMREEFHLGGTLAGVALLYSVAFLAPGLVARAGQFEYVVMVMIPLYLEIGIVVHWVFRMEHRISYDPLLHIYNRNYCTTVITEQSSLNTTPPFSVAMVDIDHFKSVNDTYGHQAGDHVLQGVAQTILREVVPDGVVCRYGGEEIAVFFPRKDTRAVVPIMENVRTAIAQLKVPTRRKKLSVTVSCGVAHRKELGQSIIDVIHAADKALYRAKKGGRNQVKSGKVAARAAKKKKR
jgi:diguanylate cyclase (GGDEF)-like protein